MGRPDRPTIRDVAPGDLPAGRTDLIAIAAGGDAVVDAVMLERPGFTVVRR